MRLKVKHLRRVAEDAARLYDSNVAILAAAVEEAGGSAKPLGIGPDDEIVLSRLVDEGLAGCDMVILSGGTSKGAGDLCYRAIAQGIVYRKGDPRFEGQCVSRTQLAALSPGRIA
jgi:molybdopterin biosynthesis enzyme